MVALDLDCVFAGYGETVVIENIRLQLKEGETLSIIGRNGVGKSTLLSTAIGHTTLHGGTIRLHGANISNYVPISARWQGSPMFLRSARFFLR